MILGVAVVAWTPLRWRPDPENRPDLPEGTQSAPAHSTTTFAQSSSAMDRARGATGSSPSMARRESGPGRAGPSPPRPNQDAGPDPAKAITLPFVASVPATPSQSASSADQVHRERIRTGHRPFDVNVPAPRRLAARHPASRSAPFARISRSALAPGSKRRARSSARPRSQVPGYPRWRKAISAR